MIILNNFNYITIGFMKFMVIYCTHTYLKLYTLGSISQLGARFQAPTFTPWPCFWEQEWSCLQCQCLASENRTTFFKALTRMQQNSDTCFFPWKISAGLNHSIHLCSDRNTTPTLAFQDLPCWCTTRGAPIAPESWIVAIWFCASPRSWCSPSAFVLPVPWFPGRMTRNGPSPWVNWEWCDLFGILERSPFLILKKKQDGKHNIT